MEYVYNSTELPAGNSTLAIGGFSCFADSFVTAESSVLRISIVLKSLPIANLQTVSHHLKKQH
jgi:hypothetical protein